MTESLERPSAPSIFIKSFALILVITSLAFCGWILFDHFSFTYAPPSKKLSQLWRDDLQLLSLHGKLPSQWSDVSEIEIVPVTDAAKIWARDLTPPLLVKADGRHKLEILLISVNDGATTAAIVQQSLIDLKTNNLIFELGRTYILDGEANQ